MGRGVGTWGETGKGEKENERRDPPPSPSRRAASGPRWCGKPQLKWRPVSNLRTPLALARCISVPVSQSAASPPEQVLGRGREATHEVERHPHPP